MTPRPVRKKVKRLDGQLNVGVNAKGNLVKMRPVRKKKVYKICDRCGNSYHRQCRNCCHDKRMFGGNRLLALVRDGYKCVSCNMTDKRHRKIYGKQITVDHIDGHGSGYRIKNNKLENLQTLCFRCHSSKDIRHPRYELNGEARRLTEWSTIYKVDYNLLRRRITHGWSLSRALSEKKMTPQERGKIGGNSNYKSRRCGKMKP